MSMQTAPTKKITLNTLQAKKNQEKITAITAYDALFAKMFDTLVDVILVGDSLNMSFLAKEDTLSATMDMMLYHTKAVCAGAKIPFVIADMPFGSYKDEKTALKNAIRVYKETKADAIKLEGGKEKASLIKTLTNEGIIVVGHIGLMPQFVRLDGGYKIKGKNEEQKKKLLDDALSLEEAGIGLLVLEGITTPIAKDITQRVKIPTIGIGSGKDCDGQILVWSDMLGFFDSFKPKFVREYLNGKELVQNAIKQYADDVKNGVFPNELESYN
ncbi:3-methyl-2-oxobutanoate hydroxymethyltransferase [Helicobacter cetorum]|uniref:3-methyl-2-oxobutanoate hydroxymethyltransferase n=1 Tax=Helicobacter cetorum (strain ATCC BAA-540 / CCUG 52418 / MIT 99-5656) TaxID=1163745 RepID=I0EUI9_HELCM|nr:3-methyl-2-oxobutanoate hydroxymethyltransferase [Helicobacter cetorum]AFI06608.1 3-methyl-2-oxobutanoate hydroxymethyltransferase [Helicobacter cetorum MIT 99-5656]